MQYTKITEHQKKLIEDIIRLGNTELKRVSKLKYLGNYFNERSCKVDLFYGISKFYSKLNNIMAVCGYNRDEIATLHLVKTYCIPTVLYGCKSWILSDNGDRRLNLMWNNSLCRIYCCWRESVSGLLFYTQTVPMSYHIDQRKILFWKKFLNCDNIAVRTVVAVNRHSIGLIMSQYKLQSISTKVGSIKKSIWECFANKAYENGKIQFCQTTSKGHLLSIVWCFLLSFVFYCFSCLVFLLMCCYGAHE